MKLDLNNLPNDTNLLHSLIKDLAYSVDSQQSDLLKNKQVISEQKQELRLHKKENRALSILVKELQRQLAVLNRVRFGRRSEKLSPDQLALFEAELDEDIAEVKARLDELLPADYRIAVPEIEADQDPAGNR